MVDITKILLAVITLLGAIITTFVVPYLKQKLSEGSWENLTIIIKTFVRAAEQIIGSGKGEVKKQKVLQWLKEQGVDIDSDMIDKAIEAAVKDMNIEMGK